MAEYLVRHASGGYMPTTSDSPIVGAIPAVKFTEKTGRYTRYYDSVMEMSFTLLVGEHGVIVCNVHGDMQGNIQVEHITGQMFEIHAAELAMMLIRAGYADKRLIVVICYPWQVRTRYADMISRKEMYVIGDWDTKSWIKLDGEPESATLTVWHRA